MLKGEIFNALMSFMWTKARNPSLEKFKSHSGAIEDKVWGIKKQEYNIEIQEKVEYFKRYKR